MLSLNRYLGMRETSKALMGMAHQNTKTLIIGAYGLIGSAISQHLDIAGHDVTCFGRNEQTANRVMPNFTWVFGDLRDYISPQNWGDLLDGVDYVINCAGALQDGADNSLRDVHHSAVTALAEACKAKGCWLIQISAVGVDKDASTEFLSSKALGDEAIIGSGCDHTIFRPGLVLSHTAYGGTQLMRMLSAVPVIQPISNPDTQIQTVSSIDICNAVSQVLSGAIPKNQIYDLVEDKSHRLVEIISQMRGWLGFNPAKATISIPTALTQLMGHAADLLGHLGWRSPLRTTALKVMKDDVLGDPAPWREATGHSINSLSQTLKHLPATAEDRLSARMQLLMPIIIGVLSLFWISSGIVALFEIDAAAHVLITQGWNVELASFSVGTWAFVDIALGLGVLIRKWAKPTCLLMVLVCITYLVSASVFTPALWLDPLGPLIKIFPAIMLALTARVLLESR